MIKIKYFFISLLIIFLYSCNRECDCSELKQQDNFYMINESTPYTGVCTQQIYNTTKKIEIKN